MSDNAGENAPVAPMSAAPDERWSRRRFLVAVLLILGVHVGLLYAVSERHFPKTRTLQNVPHWQWTATGDELIALTDPTLFALPHSGELGSSLWSTNAATHPPLAEWISEQPRWLQLPSEKLGATFSAILATNAFQGLDVDLKPNAPLAEPSLQQSAALPETSTLEIRGDLSKRPLLSSVAVPSLPVNDILWPSRVQAVVDTAGNVVSVVLLPPANPLELPVQNDAADQKALELARALRFAPSPRLTLGELVFHWHTVPNTATNSP